jgi:hypothetical protein
VTTRNGHDDVEVLDVGRPDASWLPTGSPQRIGLALIVGALAVGLALGFLAGHHDHHAGSAPARPVAGPPLRAVPATAPALTQLGQSCSARGGHRLQLGIEVANRSGRVLTLGHLAAQLPLGGLRPLSATLATCGQLPAPAGSLPVTTLAAGATTWLRMTFAVLVECPAPLPVQFTIAYRQADRIGVVHLPGFGDLGSVPYPGCHRGPMRSTSPGPSTLARSGPVRDG